ncbi:TonB-dependent receptor [Adhaeribacter sp. BT258]|uniref:TonB-dependent receptor n=1 Tax=Adhaeribacter terrigena TaxID=2793070 RepID=A0ABS1C5I5_9BACT|nr:TonB-dependent receptor [Adhaeribacter terrigena]MBK0404652.1 TonB-dependent receptor [Adhaeribacter terrigena]
MKRNVFFLLAQLCFFLSTAAPVQAQEKALTQISGKVTGMVTDSVSGKPIGFVTVALLASGTSQAVAAGLTDEAGRFVFQQIKPGNYDLNLSFIGYRSKALRQIAITETKPEIDLGKLFLGMAATQLKEVQVNALRPTIVQEADKMVVSIEGTALAAGKTAFEVLAQSPGVFIDQDGNIQLNGRSGVTVMLDGKLTYLSASDLRRLLESMSAENIKNIEIITQPSAKFDAEGASGILNINLKKNELRGMNGSVFVTSSTNFKQVAGTVGGNVNYKAGKWNSFLSTEVMKRAFNREGTFTRVFYDGDNTTYFDQVAQGKSRNLGPPVFRVGTDFSLNEKHSIGGMASLNRNTRWEDFNTETYLSHTQDQPKDFIRANNQTTNTFTNFTANLHYAARPDTNGTTLTGDLDFVKISNQGYSNFYNYFTAAGATQPTSTDFLYADSDNGFEIYSAKADFTKQFTRFGKVETGLKASRVTSDNDSRFFFNNQGLVLDLNRTNHFLYSENIYAAYANWNYKLSEKYALQTGLRAEETRSRGESLTTGRITRRNYLNLFPSVFLQQKFTENYQISYSYSRRIQRPNYGNLNPFVTYRDPYTYFTGNPYLRPQYTHAFGISQTYKQNYSLIFSYQHLTDVISELPILDVENATTIYTTGNVDDSRNISLTAVAPVKILKTWEANNTLTLSYNEFKTMANNQEVEINQLQYYLQTNHTLLLPHDYTLEVNGIYRGPSVYGLYQIRRTGWVNLGLRKSFRNKTIDLSLNANDIFRTNRLRFDTRIGRNINDFDQYFFSRSISITLRYKFNRGQKIEERRRNSNLEELNRM